MKKMMMSGAVGQRSSSSSVDGLMLGEFQFGGKNSIELGERNSNSQQQQRKRRFQLGESNSNSQQQERKRQRPESVVPEEDEIERALDFLKHEAERAEEAARLSHERQQQMVQIQEAQLAEQRRRHQQEETQLRDQHQVQLAQERAQSARDAEFAIQAQWARVSSFLPDLLAQAHEQQQQQQQQQAQSAQEAELEAPDATGAQSDVTSILRPDLLAPAHEQQQAQSAARDEEFEEAELARVRAREISRQRALHNQRACAQWAQLLQCPIAEVTSILRQRPYLLTQSREQLAQSARELAQERAREISRQNQRARAQWAQLLQCPIADVTSILRQRPYLLTQSRDQLAQSARELAQERYIHVPTRAQLSERALLIERGHAEFARAMRSWLNDDERRRRSSEQVISEYLNPRVRPSRDQDKDEMCTVCHDQLYDDDEEGNKIHGGITTLDCRHEYHKNCIQLWLLRKNVCPLCNRTAIPC